MQNKFKINYCSCEDYYISSKEATVKLCKRLEITYPAITYSDLIIETLEQSLETHQWRRSGVFIVNFEHISHFVLVFLLLTLSR